MEKLTPYNQGYDDFYEGITRCPFQPDENNPNWEDQQSSWYEGFMDAKNDDKAQEKKFLKS